MLRPFLRLMINPTTHQGKPHFVILDGLRGVAALAIVIFHFMEWVFPDITQNFIGHGFLAVDFFFCLSDRKSTRLNSSHVKISYAVFCLKKKKKTIMNKHIQYTY